MPEVAWIHYARPRSSWYCLAEAERDRYLGAFGSVREDSSARGGRCEGTFHVRGNGDFETVEVWIFPDAEAAFEHWSRMTTAGYARWFAFANNLGTRMEARA